ncbi:PREDICTED: late histone H2B.L4-like isoform X1 [Priapulus caudatus]|uniref:Late histone H2B.L4-like isoform X1 n=1 Tax=Priapulus caudatus TaxID=37621 RepID=A0ABM1ECW6_PRICU|nr:PREDICTED: late histone H2B.L4-like isoform X1 [Priapulus caudatus]
MSMKPRGHRVVQDAAAGEAPARQCGSEQTRQKRKKRRKESFNSYIFQVLQQVHPGKSMSKLGMSTMNGLVWDVFERLLLETCLLVNISKRSTITHKDVEAATRLVYRGDLALHAVMEGSRAMRRFNSNREAHADETEGHDQADQPAQRSAQLSEMKK